MQVIPMILFFCGIGCLIDRMMCGFVKKLSNSKKLKR